MPKRRRNRLRLIDALLALLLITCSALRIESHRSRTVLFVSAVTIVNERDSVIVHWRQMRPDQADRAVVLQRTMVRPLPRREAPWLQCDANRSMLQIRHATLMSGVFALILLRIGWYLTRQII